MVDRLTPDGTPEVRWQSWMYANPLAALDPASLAGRGRVVVLAAHPDDEVLAIGGLCRALHRHGVPLAFVYASDGEAAFGVPVGTDGDELARTRRAEAIRSLAVLGIEDPTTFFLALPDGKLADYAHLLKDFLADVLRDDDIVLAPWSQDRHPDHEVCGAVAADTARTVLQYPVWLWHWAEPGHPAAPWQRARALPLDADDRAAKRAAVAEHASQVRPPAQPDDADAAGAVLPPSVLAYFDRDVEVLFT